MCCPYLLVWCQSPCASHSIVADLVLDTLSIDVQGAEEVQLPNKSYAY